MAAAVVQDVVRLASASDRAPRCKRFAQHWTVAGWPVISRIAAAAACERNIGPGCRGSLLLQIASLQAVRVRADHQLNLTFCQHRCIICEMLALIDSRRKAPSNNVLLGSTLLEFFEVP